MNKKAQKRKIIDDDSSGDDRDQTEDLYFSDEEGGIRIDDIYIPPPPKAFCSVETTGPRLMITKIVNHFFKSYAKKQVLGPFHKCFNAIVGPNGSGKSNVIDSMLFVFGYRASKIRSKKISVLLHNSEHYQNIQSCTVEVHFAVINDKENDNYEIIPNSEFIVSRTAHKDNSSYYQLNGHRVQFKEVALILRKHGVDLDHNRFLILQGEVEQIAMMKSKAQNEHETGLLEYLEDIIGTSRFKKPLVQLQDKVEILAEQRTEKLNRLKLVEKELEELKQPMEEAVGFLKLENSITHNKNVFYQKHIRTLQLKIEELNSQKEEVQTICDELIEKVSALQQAKAEKEEILRGESRKYENLEKRRDSLKEAFDQANNKDIQLQAEMQQLNKNRKRTKELLAEERKKLVEYECIPGQNREKIEECETREIELNAKKETLEEEKLQVLANLRTETQELQEQKEVLQTELAELNRIVAETKEPFALAESELKIYLSNEESEKKKLEIIKEQYERAKTTMQERSQSIMELEKRIPQMEKSIQNIIEELNELKIHEVKIVNETKAKRAQLEESKSSMQASRSRGRVLDSLMQQKREGNCSGLFGRLGDLGAIDFKYDVAISTACGPLDNIVVDTVETAQWCIEFLKRTDIGRATFIALDKQEYLRGRATSFIKTPENVPRLFDLVQIQDKRVQTAFYYALRDTLVANDLDQASRIAYGGERYRVVTLNGDMIEMTGTMSGGGKRVSRGRMGQSVTTSNINPSEIQRMESELVNQEQELSEIRQNQISLENQLNILQPELRQMKANIEKFNVEMKSLPEQLPVLEQQLKKQEAKARSSKADSAQVKKLTDAVNKKKAEYEKAVASAQKIQVKVDKLTAEIKEKTVDKIKAIDKKIKEVCNIIDKCKNEITKLRVAIKTVERNAKKSSEKISVMEQDIVNAENSLRDMKMQREEIETDAAKLLKGIEELTEKLEEGQEEYAGVKQEVAILTRKENKIKAEKIEIDQKLKTVEKSINDRKSEIHSWRMKLKQLKLQDIPNETVEDLKELNSEELDAIDIDYIKRDLHLNEDKIKALKPNLNAIQEYCKKQDVFVERTKELDAISEKKSQMRDMLEQVRNKRKEEFLAGYNIIKLKLKEMYQMITLGGDADFEMVDTFDPFTEGIQFNVRPPKKSWKMISNLSGGEKTLSSLALVFALHYYKPSPLYVMDEIDAALDFKNVSIVGNYIKERTKNAQFIIISLRSNMFELCDYLIGIYKTFHCTKSLTIDPRKYDKKKTQAENVPEYEQSGGDMLETTENMDNEKENTDNSENQEKEHIENEGESARNENNSINVNASEDSNVSYSVSSLPNGEIINDSFEAMEIDA